MSQKDLSRGSLQKEYDRQIKDVCEPAKVRFDEGEYPYTDDQLETIDETEDGFNWVDGQ
jgi:hypothetical protein